MSQNESPNGDPLVRSLDPFTQDHLQTPDEQTERLNENATNSAESVEETGELPVAGAVPPPSNVVQAEPDSDMDLLGFDKRKS